MVANGTPGYNAMLAEAQRQQKLVNQMGISQGKLYLMELAERMDAAKRQSQQGGQLAGAMGGGAVNGGVPATSNTSVMNNQQASDYYNNAQRRQGGAVINNGKGVVKTGYGPVGPGMLINGHVVSTNGYAYPVGTVDDDGAHPLVGFYSAYPLVLNDYSLGPRIVSDYLSGVRDFMNRQTYAPMPKLNLNFGGGGGRAGGGGGAGNQAASSQSSAQRSNPMKLDPSKYEGYMYQRSSETGPDFGYNPHPYTMDPKEIERRRNLERYTLELEEAMLRDGVSPSKFPSASNATGDAAPYTAREHGSILVRPANRSNTGQGR